MSVCFASVPFKAFGSPIETLHEGPYSSVYTCKVLEEYDYPNFPAQGAEVVVKRVKMRDIVCLDRFEKEVEMLRMLQHPNIACPVASCEQAPDFCIVLKKLQSSVHDVLHHPDYTSTRQHLPLSVAFGMCLDLADGLKNMHDRDIVHRDLKPGNALLDDNLTALLTDFSFADHVSQIGKTRRNDAGPSGGFYKAFIVGTLLYMAPELSQKGLFTKKADVYSLGITLNEIMTGCIPYSDVKTTTLQMHTVIEAKYDQISLKNAIIVERLRPNMETAQAFPPVSQSTDTALKRFNELICCCWSHDLEKRPDMEYVLQELESIISDCGIDVSTAARLDAMRDAQSCTQQTETKEEENMDTTTSATSTAQKNIMEIYKDVDVSFNYVDCLPRNNMSWGCNDDTHDNDAGLPDLRMGDIANCGKRGADRMEDRHVLAMNLQNSPSTTKQNKNQIHVMGVFDGHGGVACADFCAKHLLCQLSRSWKTFNFDRSAAAVASALKDAFISLDYHFVYNNDGGVDNSGCTAMVGMIVGRDLHVAGAGDCRAVVSRCGKAVALSEDHNADNKIEQQRIIQGGGTVVKTADGHMRVNGQIQVTRSIGDRQMKRHGLIPVPTVQSYKIDPKKDEFLIIACDGVWDVMSDQAAVDAVEGCAKAPDMACKTLLAAAMNAGSTDNITIIVALFRKEEDYSSYAF